MSLPKSRSTHLEKALSPEEQQSKINEVRKLTTPLSDRLPSFCTDASISRFLRARNWNVEKASKMMKEAVKWRLQYKPEAIRWEDVSHEAETGKIYRADYRDKHGRSVLVMRPGYQNTKSAEGQIKYLVYCMENAILNLTEDQEQMVWLIDFQGWTMGSVSIKVTHLTANVLQNYYPERLALAILYNPPRIFESFWKVVKPFLEHKTYKKVKFVYSDDIDSQKTITDIFDLDKLDSAFGGHSPVGFNYNQYAEIMKADDKKKSALLTSGHSTIVQSQEQPLDSDLQIPESSKSEEEAASENSSPDIPSAEAEGSDKPEEAESKEHLTCKTSVTTSEHPPDVIQIRETV